MIRVFLLVILLIGNAFGAVVQRIEIYGLKWTKERFVKRELLIKEGEKFDPKALSLSIRNLLNTHLFYSVKAKVERSEGRAIVKLYLKEKFPIVPIPRIRVKEDGSYKTGFEVRDYNLLGMGHKLYVSYSRWFNLDRPFKKGSIYFNLYRVVKEKGDISFGAFYWQEERELIENGKGLGSYYDKSYSFPVYLKFYLDKEKVNQLSLGIRPFISLPDKLLSDRRLYYINFSYTKDKSTDMVYYTVGSKLHVGGEISIPELSSVYTGRLELNYSNSLKKGDLKTWIASLSVGTKVGYSGKGYNVNSPILGYRESEVSNKKYVALNCSYRFPLVDRSVFLKPSLWLGDSFKNLPDDLLVSGGIEVDAFWAKLADGIIRFKVFRGLGPKAETQSSFRLSFRW